MSQVIVFTTEKGNVAVCYPTGELPIEEVLVKDCPAGAIILNQNDLPNEHGNFFDAWELIGGAVLVNMNKAKELTKERLREERKLLLQAQDVAFQRALETGSDTSAIVAEKQRLRDITKLADEATTLEGLQSIKA